MKLFLQNIELENRKNLIKYIYKDALYFYG